MNVPTGATPDDRADLELLVDRLTEPIALEIDHERQARYWADRGNSAARGNSLNRADMTATGLAHHEVLATGLKEGIGLALDLERRRGFVADLRGAIRVVPMDGGSFITIHPCSGSVTGLAFLPAND
ncbi:hypothetical protein [Burkholderia alba]|uniref:hypothetical protein n=1 Tax=Burkholderia alba TaxID=2683677 RepID=UPI002B05486A|nr:hypothetical protein [Burkholderia alba]